MEVLLEERSPMLADRVFIAAFENDTGVGQRFEELAGAQGEIGVAHRRCVLGPRRADVVVPRKFTAPGGGIDHIAVPLDDQDMVGRDMRA